MRAYRFLSIVVGTALGVLLSAAIVSAWTGPGASPPGSNVSAPVNVGTTAQAKNGDLGVNNFTAFGNVLISGLGTNLTASPFGRYLNFDYTSGGTSGTGISGYGIRDNNGTLEFKNVGGSWASLQSTISGLVGSGQWTTSATNIYNANAGDVGIRTNSPNTGLQIGSGGDGVANGLTIYSSYPTIFFRNAAGYQTAMIHVNGNQFYILRGCGSNDPAGGSNWCTVLGRWPLQIDLTNNNAFFGGNVYANAFLYNSDARLKTNVQPLNSELVTLLQMRPVTFTWNDTAPLKGQNDFGFIAQEMQKLAPEIVHQGQDGFLTIDYAKLTPILVKALQEENEKVDTQQTQIDALKSDVQEQGDEIKKLETLISAQH